MPTVPLIPLNDGNRIPVIGFGVYQIRPEHVQQVVEEALALGYRHIDTAGAYFNEAGVGAGLRAALRATGIAREELFVTTKLRNAFQGREKTRAEFLASLDRLGLEYVDLYLIHWPNPREGRYVETWEQLAKLRQERLTRSIGVSNFLEEHLDALAAAQLPRPAVNQIEVHPSFAQQALVTATAQRGIAVEAYSPLGRGEDLTDPVIHAIAEVTGRTAAQIVLRWSVERNIIVLPKASHASRLAENIDVLDFALTSHQRDAIDALDRGARTSADPNIAHFSQLEPWFG